MASNRKHFDRIVTGERPTKGVESAQVLDRLEPVVRIELTTYGLRNRCRLSNDRVFVNRLSLFYHFRLS